MTPEAQRIAIAEACPKLFKVSTGTFADKMLYRNDDGMLGPAVDPLSDLNAMHEAEKVLTRWEDKSIYVIEVGRAIDRGKKRESDHNFAIVHATAAQRAEAFLQTLNLWK